MSKKSKMKKVKRKEVIGFKKSGKKSKSWKKVKKKENQKVITILVFKKIRLSDIINE